MLSIIIGFKFSFEKKSFVSLINETGKPKNKLNKIYRTIISFVMLCGFFITFFSLIVEWFTLALHEPIILLGSFAIIYFISSLKSKNIKNTV